MRALLAVADVNPLSSKKPGIDGSVSRSEHCQGGAECGEQDRGMKMVRSSNGDPQFSYSDEHAGNGSPQTYKEQQPCAGYDALLGDQLKAVRNHQSCDAAVNQQTSGHQT